MMKDTRTVSVRTADPYGLPVRTPFRRVYFDAFGPSYLTAALFTAALYPGSQASELLLEM